MALRNERSGVFHRLPTGRFAEQPLRKFHRHSATGARRSLEHLKTRESTEAELPSTYNSNSNQRSKVSAGLRKHQHGKIPDRGSRQCCRRLASPCADIGLTLHSSSIARHRCLSSAPLLVSVLQRIFRSRSPRVGFVHLLRSNSVAPAPLCTPGRVPDGIPGVKTGGVNQVLIPGPAR